VQTADEAVGAARELGLPVVLKTAAPGAHKTEQGGIALDLHDEEQIRAAAGRIGPPLLVQPMVSGGAELLAGIVQDPVFGPLVAFGPGGVFTIYVEHQPGAKVWVSEHAVTTNGRESNRLRRARFEARRSSRDLTDACGFNVTVQSVLILIGAATMQTVSHPAEVHVRTQHDIRDWLCRQPPRLDSDMVRAIYDRVHGDNKEE